MHRYLGMTLLAGGAFLLWYLSIGDPCLVAGLRGSTEPGANPIAITTCGYVDGGRAWQLTVGDAIVRLFGLFVVAGLVAFVIAAKDPGRNRVTIHGVMQAGFALAGAIYLVLRATMSLRGPELAMFAAAGLAGVAVTWAGTSAGLAQAAVNWRRKPD